MKTLSVLFLLFALVAAAVSGGLSTCLPSPAATSTLKRADMIVAGSSCASCLIRIERKLKARPGVLKAMVSVYRPYPAIVVYDSAKTSMKEIAKVFSGENASAVKIVEKPIEAVPILMLPLYK